MSKPPRWMTPRRASKIHRRRAGHLYRAVRQRREIVPELVKRGVRPDMVTDQTSAHDPLHGYLPKGWSWEEYQQKAESDPQGTILAAKRSMADHVQAMLAFHEMGVPTFDYGNNIRQMAQEVGVSNAFDFPGFVPAYIRPLFCAVSARSAG